MIICNITKNDEFIGVIGFNNKNIGYLSHDEELNKQLDIITDYDFLNIGIEEQVNDQTLILNKKVGLNDDLYLYGLMEYVQYPYKISSYKEISGDFKNVLIEEFNDNLSVLK